MAWISPEATVRSMSSLATTPGNRLVMPRSSMAGGLWGVWFWADGGSAGSGVPGVWSGAGGGSGGSGAWGAGSGPDGMRRPPGRLSAGLCGLLSLLRLRRAYGSVGTVMSPEVIWDLYSSSWSTMSSMNPPEVL